MLLCYRCCYPCHYDDDGNDEVDDGQGNDACDGDCVTTVKNCGYSSLCCSLCANMRSYDDYWKCSAACNVPCATCVEGCP